MKAWRVHAFGDMRLDEVPEPPVKPGWVKVQVRVAQASITETLLFEGVETFLYDQVKAAIDSGPTQLFGHEFSGVVAEISPEVTTLAPGDRVVPRGSHPDGIVGFDYPGALAEYLVVPESLLAKVPDHVSDCEGAAIQPLTDAVAGVHAAEIRLGDVVAVIGQGAMGLASLQAAAAAGAGTIIAIAKRDEVLDISRQVGATHCINTTKEDPVAAVLDITDGIGADAVFEAAGGPPSQGLAGDEALNQAAAMACNHGKVVGIALQGEGTFLPYAGFRHRSIRYMFPSMLDRRLFETSVELVSSGRIDLKPLLAPPLKGIEEMPEAFKRTANKSKYGLINPAQVVISE